MHPSTTAPVHQLMPAMEGTSPGLFEHPGVAASDAVCLPESRQPTCPSTLDLDLDLELHHDHVSDVGSSVGSESAYVNTNESIFSQGGISETTAQTETTALDDDDGIDEARSSDHMLGCEEQDQDMYDNHRLISPYECQANIAPVIHFARQRFGGDEVVDSAPGSTWAGTYRDQHGIKLEQTAGPARHYHQPGTSDETTRPDTEGDSRPDRNTGQVNASWPHPEKSNIEVREVINDAQRLDLFPDSAPSSHPYGSNKTPHGTEAASGSFMAATPSSGTAYKSLSSEADGKTLSSPSSAARKARMHLLNGELHRLMPRGREIHFDVDTDSFLRGHIPQPVIKCLIDAAIGLAEVFTRQRLGITFSYAPGPGRKVFRICYDPSLHDPDHLGATLAESFFPADPPEHRRVRISPVAMRPVYYGGGFEYMTNILAHEFTHILGFRHWNAGFDACELLLPSAHLPGTVDGDRDSIMYTPLHGQLWFSQEDYRVIRAVYSAPNGGLVRDRWLIKDIDPYV